MQLNEIQSGWFRKRMTFHGTLMAADLATLEVELAQFHADVAASIEHYGRPAGRVQLFIASGMQSIRPLRPQMKTLVQNDPQLRQLAAQCKVTACFLTRMGDRQDCFKVHGA